MTPVYFACSIRGGRDDSKIYAELINHINTQANVLSEIFADQKLTSQGMNSPSSEIWKKDTDWINEATAIIAEVSNPSLGVGYEIAYAENLNKPILALYREQPNKKLSAMIDGSPKVQVVVYKSISEAKEAINNFVKKLKKAS